jgi:hypothetical protein
MEECSRLLDGVVIDDVKIFNDPALIKMAQDVGCVVAFAGVQHVEGALVRVAEHGHLGWEVGFVDDREAVLPGGGSDRVGAGVVLSFPHP